MPKVLVLEKTGAIQALLTHRFDGDRISIDTVPMVENAMEQCRATGYDVLIWDSVASKTEQSKGLELLDRLTKNSSRTYIIVVTDQWASPIGLDRLRAYSHRTLTRPLQEDEICALVTQAFLQQASGNGVIRQRENSIPLEFEGMLGVSLPMQEVFKRIVDAASEDISVLITGETGTGKDMVASAIHRRSRRRNGPYVAVNTGAISSELIASELFGREKGAYTGADETAKGHFEQAHGGSSSMKSARSTRRPK